ncbi:MAG: RNA methyltransferase [Flavobacteriales bacterium]|nr:RNA methyltransferase [Flavobacteriales bacterium]HPF89538.1 RNA methyltransferase [Flavobacteriales bacterium]
MPATDRKLQMHELERPTAAEHHDRPKRPIRIILDDVRSRHNVGSIFRTADAFGAEGIVLCGFTPQPPHREIEKTALGATDSVPWTTAGSAEEAVRELQAQGYRVLAVEQTAEALALPQVNGGADERVALVFGNELNGVSDEVVHCCDGCVIVPQHGSKHSLNVSVCAGVVLWHCTRW